MESKQIEILECKLKIAAEVADILEDVYNDGFCAGVEAACEYATQEA